MYAIRSYYGLIPIILSLFIVFGSLISYQNYKKHNKKRYFIFWIMIISFSIATGISGQLNKGIENVITSYSIHYTKLDDTNFNLIFLSIIIIPLI